MFLPSFKPMNRRPVVFLHKTRIESTGQIVYYCHSGLWKTIVDWCKSKGIRYTSLPDAFKLTGFDMSLEDFTKYVDSWGMDIIPRDYQYEAPWKMLHYRQSLSRLATRAGKTLIAYIIFRTMKEKMGAHNLLMIVPNISLVEQALGDFKDYGDYFNMETVWSKGEYVECADLTIGTYQSLIRRCEKYTGSTLNKHYDPKFFDKYDVVCVDEAHHLKCESINTILSQGFVKNCKLMFGFTGTLPKEGTIDSFMCHSLMGPTIQEIRSKTLMDEGYIAKVNITQARLYYSYDDELEDLYIKCGEYLCSNYVLDADHKKVLLPKEARDFTMIHQKVLPDVLVQAKSLIHDPHTKRRYIQLINDLCTSQPGRSLTLEQMLMHHSEKRLDYIYNIIQKRGPGNCILFAHHTEYIKALERYFKDKFPDKKVLVIRGGTKLKDRLANIQAMLDSNECILVASYGCVGTGLTLKNISYGMFTEGFSSDIINLQAIGRGLLKTATKDVFDLYDIIDVYPTKRLYVQGKTKIKTYEEEEYDYKVVDVDKPERFLELSPADDADRQMDLDF